MKFTTRTRSYGDQSDAPRDAEAGDGVRHVHARRGDADRREPVLADAAAAAAAFRVVSSFGASDGNAPAPRVTRGAPRPLLPPAAAAAEDFFPVLVVLMIGPFHTKTVHRSSVERGPRDQVLKPGDG